MIDTTSMTMWYKGYEGVLIGGVPPANGGTIDQWENQISTTDALQTTGGNRPTWHANQINGKGIVRFDGVSQFMEVAHGADTNLLNPMTFFYVVYVPAFTSYTVPFSKGINNVVQQYSSYLQPAPLAGRVTYCTTSNCQESGSQLTAASWERVIIRGNSSNNRLYIYRNGVEISVLNPSMPNNATVVAPMLIGKRVDNLMNPFDLLELGVLNRNITDDEVLDLDCYLAGVTGA